MFGEKQTRKLILVCTKDTKKYGMYLMQLIGTKDDSDSQVVGLEDSSIEAVLWTEEEYESNRPTISSTARILFIGSSKLMMDEKANMNELFNKYGMHFAALGNSAVMYIDKRSFGGKEYQGFLSFAQEYEKKFNDLKMNLKKGANAAIFGVSLFIPVIAGVPALIYSVISMRKNAVKIKEQRFSFLTFYAYLKLLPEFMEE